LARPGDLRGSARGVGCGVSQGGGSPSYWAYSGDSDNVPVARACNDPNESVTVAAEPLLPTPEITVTGLKRDRKEVEAQALALIAKVRLQGKEQAYPGELSGGQQQRIAIARSLAMNPDVMLFDEVTAALDPETVKGVLVTIRELAEDGMTCMIVTHEMGFAREVAHQVYFTDGGLLVEHGPPREFFSNPRDPRTKQFLDQIL